MTDKPIGNKQRSERAELIVQCLAELHQLSKLPRIGWVLAGVQNPESVATHCFETAVIARILTRFFDQEVDLGKVLTMALFHEAGEVRLTDLPRRAAPYVKPVKSQAEQAIVKDVLGGIDGSLLAILDEFHEGKTLEARLAEAAEELQIIFAALMYAKEQNGDITEYRQDADRFVSDGIDVADEIAAVIRAKLGGYLSDKPYWSIGYDRST